MIDLMNEKNYLEKLKEYVKNNSKHMTRIDNTLFELIMYVHPQSESIKDDLNRKYLSFLLNYGCIYQILPYHQNSCRVCFLIN